MSPFFFSNSIYSSYYINLIIISLSFASTWSLDGTTSSGKTFTTNGLTTSAFTDVFDIASNTCADRDYSISVSFVEVYNETVIDLLNPSAPELKLQDDGNGSVQIQGVTRAPISSIDEAKAVISKGRQNRKTAGTSANQNSSRSHSIIQVTIKSVPNVITPNDATLVSNISLVDLAGSESADCAGHNLTLKREAANIRQRWVKTTFYCSHAATTVHACFVCRTKQSDNHSFQQMSPQSPYAYAGDSNVEPTERKTYRPYSL